MQLHTEVRGGYLQFGGKQLGLGRVHRGEGAGIEGAHTLVDIGLGKIQLRAHFRHTELGILEGRQGLAEGLALAHELRGQVPGQLRRGQVTDGADQALLGQTFHQVNEALARLAQHIGLGHLDVVEEELGGILGLEAHLAQVAPALETFHAPLHQEQGHVMGIVLGVGLRRDNDQVGVDAVGNVGLGALEHPVVVGLHRGGAHAREVAAGVGLGHGNRQDGLAAHTPGQEALTLFLATEAGEVGANQATVQGGVPVTDPGVSGLLHDDLLEAEIAVAHAPEALLGPDHEEALLPRLAEGLAIDDPCLAPAFHVRHNLRRQELAIGISEQLLFFGEITRQHHGYLFLP